MLDSLPSEWRLAALTELCRPKQHRTIPKSAFTKTGFPVYGANGKIGFFNEYTHAEQTIAITCRGATCGTINVVPPKSYITGNAMALDDLKSDLVKFGYLEQALRFFGVEKSITGSAQPQITGASLKSVYLPVPPIIEQQRIAEILTSVDDSIRATETVIAQAERVKRGLMEDLLTGGLGSAAIARGEVPEGWDNEKLANLTYRPISYGVLKPGDYVANGVPMLRIQDAKNGWKYEDLWRISATLDEEYKRTRVNEGDLIFSVVGTLGECKQINAALAGANVSRAFAVIGLSEAVEKDYVFHFLTSDFVLAWVAETGRGGAQKVINLGDLRKLTVPLPSANEQRRIVEVLNCSAEQIAQNRKGIEQLQRLKRGLMDDLLTGRVRTV